MSPPREVLVEDAQELLGVARVDHQFAVLDVLAHFDAHVFEVPTQPRHGFAFPKPRFRRSDSPRQRLSSDVSRKSVRNTAVYRQRKYRNRAVRKIGCAAPDAPQASPTSFKSVRLEQQHLSRTSLKASERVEAMSLVPKGREIGCADSEYAKLAIGRATPADFLARYAETLP